MKEKTLFLFLFILLIQCGDSVNVEANKITSQIELGEKLFFDPILSLDKTISCASCHKPKFAFADNRDFSLGVGDSLGIRNVPSVMNMTDRSHFFYDGRANTLEEQAIIPIENPIEMNLHIEEAVKRLQESKLYTILFQKLYTEKPSKDNLANALSEFQRSLESNGTAPHDKWMNDEDPAALTLSQQRGRELFLEKAKCFDCHFGPDFTGDEFRNIGTYDGIGYKDRGRFDETKDSNDLGKFKVPGLRNVALTAPYMHDGTMETLEEVIEYYSDPYMFVGNPINMDSIMIKPLKLTDQEKEDLVNFLHSLTDETKYEKR